MGLTRRLGVVVAAGSLGAVIKSMLKGKDRGGEDTEEGGVLREDDTASPVAHSLTAIQERPTFETDERGRPFAMIADQDPPQPGISRRKPFELAEPGEEQAN